MIGGRDGVFPGFAKWLDPQGVKNEWDNPNWFENVAEDEKTELKPRWHQLVGIVEGVKAAFGGKNILLMDEVGLQVDLTPRQVQVWFQNK